MHLSLQLKFLFSLVLGAIIGLEREASQRPYSEEYQEMGIVGGVRAFALISALGSIAGFLIFTPYSLLGWSIVFTVFSFVIAYYAIGSYLTKSTDLTTELGTIFTFLLGFFLTSEIIPIQAVVALTVILSVILSIKEQTKTFVLGISRDELSAFIGFAVVALVILPFLPNKSYYLTDIPAVRTILSAYHLQLSFLEKLEIINPFKLWFIVALITGIDVFGYLMGRILGERHGILLTSAVGGFISSTSTTQSLAQQSKTSSQINKLVSAAVLANLASFLQIFLLIAPLNSEWLVWITPNLLIIIISALFVAIYFLRNKGEKREAEEEGSEVARESKKKAIFNIKPAVKFAIILVAIRAITKTSLVFFGQAGFLVSSVIASFSGIDAIVINLAEMAGGPIPFKSALLVLLVVNATNLLSKAIYSFFQGKREFSLKFTIAMLLVIFSSVLGYFIV